MQNDPELDGKYLGNITKDFVKVYKIMQEAAYQMRVRKISDYPIFPMTKSDSPVGQVIIERNTSNLDWNYYASFLEEFIAAGLIQKPEHFKEAYKNPDEFCCLFVIDAETDFMNFVFLPFPEEENHE